MDNANVNLEVSGESLDARPPNLFRHADFMKLWTGETISEFGSKVGGVAISFLAVIALHATPAQMAALAVWRTVPALMFSLFAGVWVDRIRRRPLMIGADLANIALLASIPAAAAFGKLRIEQVYVVMFLTSFADILFSVGYRAYLPTLVGRDAITQANSILSATEAVAEMGAFGLAGWLVQWLTAPIAIATDAVSFVFSLIFLRLISKPEGAPTRRKDSRVATEILEGARGIVDDSRLLAVASSAAVGAIASGIFSTVYALYFINELGFRPGPLGMIYATGGAASFVGAAITTRTADRIGIGRAMALGLAAMGLGFALLTFAHGAGIVSIALMVSQQLIGDSFGTIYFVTQMSLIQKIAPAQMLGRVVASVRFLGLGAGLFGSLLGAAMSNLIGLRYAIGFGALLLFVAAAIIMMSEVERSGAEPTVLS
ncbi:MAG TPA: MFS transporter [Candidatus Binataceae bacterium]|nr:MFS transporter [Candidatus Binataceae bacterium]